MCVHVHVHVRVHVHVHVCVCAYACVHKEVGEGGEMSEGGKADTPVYMCMW
jgi:hypothetical protein